MRTCAFLLAYWCLHPAPLRNIVKAHWAIILVHVQRCVLTVLILHTLRTSKPPLLNYTIPAV